MIGRRDRAWESGRFDDGAAFGGEPIFLKAAFGLIGDGGFEEWEDVAFVIQIGVGETGGFQKLGHAAGSGGTGLQDYFDLLTVGEVFGFLQGGEDGGDEELNECGGFSSFVADGQSLVIFRWAVFQ